MGVDEKELLEFFDEMMPENKAQLLVIAHATCAAQKITQKAIYEKLGIMPESIIPEQKAVKTA